jgi:TRAP-type C4-dicarboxylate transport system permease small subunit
MALRMIRTGLARLESLATYLGALTILVLGGLITASGIGRALFNTGIPDTITLAGLLMIPVVALPMAGVQAQDGHIAGTVTSDWMPARWISALRALGNVIGFAFFAAIIWFMMKKVPRDIATGAYYDGELELPVWPMKVGFAVGISLFLIRLIFDFSRNLALAFGFRSTDT